MEITVADQRILFFPDQISVEDAKNKSWEKKLSAFSTINQFTSFLSRPKDDDFELVYSEHRYQPFWHVAAKARYVYERTGGYEVPVNTEVRRVTAEKITYEVTNGHFHLPVLEHCLLEESDEVFVDGISGKQNPDLRLYLSKSPEVVKGKLEASLSKDAIIVPPQTRVSAIMRDSLSKMIKGIQADKILEEQVEVTCVDLYYHPIFAYQYRWKSKAKDGIVEIDGVSGAVQAGSRVFSEYLGKVLDINFLFDVGADAAGMLIPGGSIAVKVAKKYIDSRKK